MKEHAYITFVREKGVTNDLLNRYKDPLSFISPNLGVRRMLSSNDQDGIFLSDTECRVTPADIGWKYVPHEVLGDWPLHRRILLFLLNVGCSDVYYCGTIGDSVHMTYEKIGEYDALYDGDVADRRNMKLGF